MYKVEIHEQGHRIHKGDFENLEIAKKFAMKWVDDALPSNTVHVLDDSGKEIGYAFLEGDGGNGWKEKA